MRGSSPHDGRRQTSFLGSGVGPEGSKPEAQRADTRGEVLGEGQPTHPIS